MEKGNTSHSQETVCKRLQEESDRTGKLVKCEENRVMNVHDRTEKFVEFSTHTVQEFDSLGHRDIASSNANKFNFAIDEENIDFDVSGVPNAMVEWSHCINVHNLIQQIENHPQRQAFQSDLQQHRAFNLFSKESKDAIMVFGNIELCEIVGVEPKSQCRACLTYWDVGIVYRTCGHLMEDDTTENEKKISSVLDLFSIPNFYITKDRSRSQVREERLQRILNGRTILKEMSKETLRKHSRSIYPWQVVQKDDDRVGSLWRSHFWNGSIGTQEEIDVHDGNWWIRSSLVNSDTMLTRR